MKKIKNILCIYPEPAELRISALLNRQGIVVDMTEAAHSDAIKSALTQPSWWDLILCDAAVFFEQDIVTYLAPVRDRLDASLILLKGAANEPRPAEGLSCGAADVVQRDDVDHLLAVCEREIRNAATRKQLRELRHSVVGESGGRSQFVVPTISDLGKHVHQGGLRSNSGEVPKPLDLNRVRALIDAGGLTLEYQPIVALRPDGQHRNMFETLVRLKDEAGRLLLPDAFLPLAVEADWIGNIDLWICRQAIAVLEQMQSSGAPDAVLFVNLSLETLKSEKQIRAIGAFFSAAHLTPGSIVIEIKKAALKEARDGVERLAEMLKAKRHGILLEDPRLEELQLLESYPDIVTHVKLSAATVQGLVEGAASQQALNAFVRCAHKEGMQVIALAVENAELMPILFAAGVDAIQGNFTCVPNQELVYPSVTMVESAPII
ncbi:EAL domain-containing protein [Thiorhodococcus minor]|uniref:EAL domain-containing protein n=1 Tax=Thiorhodococcus minor TaxID=57489 RepID=A0A6M0K326_9GAMM|nr:EAL domain-containing protein [Thiorhodococcus minor]NEV63363.1 EAL domain-containing protein [Thiorhodococcus minor]